MLGKLATGAVIAAAAFVMGRKSVSSKIYSDRFIQLKSLNDGEPADSLIAPGRAWHIEANCMALAKGELLVATEQGLIELRPVRIPHTQYTSDLVKRFQELIPDEGSLHRLHADRYASLNSSDTFIILRRISEKAALTNTLPAIIIKE